MNIVKVDRLSTTEDGFASNFFPDSTDQIYANYFLDADGLLWANGDGRINGLDYDVADTATGGKLELVAGKDDPIVDMVSLSPRTSMGGVDGGSFVYNMQLGMAALTASGKVLTWGGCIYAEADTVAKYCDASPSLGNDKTTPYQLTPASISHYGIVHPQVDWFGLVGKPVKKLVATDKGFYALTENGQLFGWGNTWAPKTQASTSNPNYYLPMGLTFEYGTIVDIFALSKAIIVKNSDDDFYALGWQGVLQMEGPHNVAYTWYKVDWMKDVVDISASSEKPILLKNTGEVVNIRNESIDEYSSFLNGSKVFTRGRTLGNAAMVIDQFGRMYQNGTYNCYPITNVEDIPAGTLIRTIRH